MERTLFTEDHNIFRHAVRKFVEERIVPFHDDWEKAGQVPRSIWEEAGTAGLLCCTVPEEYGGPGADFMFSAIVCEEVARVGATGPLNTLAFRFKDTQSILDAAMHGRHIRLLLPA